MGLGKIVFNRKLLNIIDSFVVYMRVSNVNAMVVIGSIKLDVRFTFLFYPVLGT